MPKPSKKPAEITTSLPPTSKLSAKAQTLYDDVHSKWEISPPVEALLMLACESMSRAEACDEIIARESMVIKDQKGSLKSHPLCLLARDMRSHASSTIQRLLAHLG